MRHLILTSVLFLALGAAPALGQEPEDPEPIDPEIWTVEEDAGAPSTPPGRQPASEPGGGRAGRDHRSRGPASRVPPRPAATLARACPRT